MLLRHIRYFLAVAEHGNFTKAAEALYVSQPTLSQQIRQLEDTLQTQLLDRSGRVVRLTDAGEAWMRYAKLALQDLDAGTRAILDVAELSRGRLRLGATPTFTPYLTGAVIDDFHRRYPAIRFDLHEITQVQIEAMLLEDQLDLGIAFEPVHATGLESEALFRETLGLVVGASHRRATQRRAVSGTELAREPLVLLSKGFATRRHIDEYCHRHGIQPNVVVDANSIGAIVEIVRRGTLATILPDRIDLEHGGLYPVRLEPSLPTRTALLLRRKDAYRSKVSQVFTRLLAERLAVDR